MSIDTYFLFDVRIFYLASYLPIYLPIYLSDLIQSNLIYSIYFSQDISISLHIYIYIYTYNTYIDIPLPMANHITYSFH